MAKFVSTSIGGNPILKLDSMGRATLQITAKNLSGIACDMRAVPVSLPILNPPTGAVQNGWVTIDGSPEVHFERDQEKPIVVKVDVQMKKSPKSGSYQFRVDFLSVAKPDEYDSAQPISFDVPEIKKKEGGFPLWLIPVLIVLVIGLGVGGWLLLRPSGSVVPDLHGKTLGEADDILKKAELTLDQNNVQTAESKAEDSDKIIKQTPDAGQKAAKQQAVQVTVGAEMVAAPELIGVPFNQVLGILSAKKLVVGQTTVAPNPSFTGAVVWGQTPSAQQLVKTGTAINLQVTPQILTMPNVMGQTWATAIYSLRGLRVTSFSGDYIHQRVISQNPSPGTPIPVGSPVTLAFVPCLAGINCFYQGSYAQWRVMQGAGIAIRDLEPQKEAPPKQKEAPPK